MSGRANMWSARRAAVKAEAKADLRATEAAVLASEQAALEEKSDAEILAELDLKNPDDLVKGDDFSAFMKTAVPERIRRRALRKLWLSNPVLANVDNLVDYGEDFTVTAGISEKIKTAYQVGKGMMAHVEEMEKQALAEEGAPEEDAEQEVLASEEVEIQEVVKITEEPDAPQEDETPDFAVKRRIRFQFAS